MAPKAKPATLKKAVAYLRCSDRSQETSVKDQRSAVTKYAKANGYHLSDEYVDDGISGDDTENRTGFLTMRDNVDSGQFEFIVCWDGNRFGRFDSLDAGHWIYPFRQAGIKLVTVDRGPIEWNDFAGRMMYAIEQESHNSYLHKLSRDVVRGQSEAAKNGSWIGAVPYAYKLTGERKHKKLVVGDPREVRIVKRIFAEFTGQGRSLSDIAHRLDRDGLPTPRGKEAWRYDTIRGILANPVYAGHFRFNTHSRAKYHHLRNGEIVKGPRKGANDRTDWIEKANAHEALIKQSVFNRAQAIIAKGKNGRSRYTPETNPYLLSGLLRCGNCGAQLWGTKNKRRRKFECSHHQTDCKGMVVWEDDVLHWLSAYVEETFIGEKRQTELFEKAKHGALTEQDLPEGFAKLKRLLVGKHERRANPKTVAKQLAAIDDKLRVARRNLPHIKQVKNIPAAEEAIELLEKERAEVVAAVKNQPTELDINAAVLDVLQKLFWLATLQPERMKPVLREIDYITVFTRSRGTGHGKRYEFNRGEVVFKAQGNTGKSNHHCLVQSQAAYR